MTKETLVYNLNYTFDDNLQEVPVAPDDMRRAVSALEAQVAQEQDLYERMKLWGTLGTYCRLLRHLGQAEIYIYSALTAANALRDKRGQVVNLLRLAHVYQWQGRYALADRLFEQIIFICEIAKDTLSPKSTNPLGGYLDFAYQHMGKSKFDQGDYARAAKFFQRALNIRKEKGDPDLIASSALALEAARRRLYTSAG